MKKFLKDNTFEDQTLSLDVAKYIFGDVIQGLTEEIIQKEKFVVLHNYKDDNYSVQIVINTGRSYENNSYFVFVFDKNDEVVTLYYYPSHTILPPVWNREFGDLDYMDFLGIQKLINVSLGKQNLPVMAYDFSIEKRSFYVTQERGNELLALIKEGKPYGIISMFAKKFPELVSQAKKFHKLDEIV